MKRGSGILLREGGYYLEAKTKYNKIKEVVLKSGKRREEKKKKKPREENNETPVSASNCRPSTPINTKKKKK